MEVLQFTENKGKRLGQFMDDTGLGQEAIAEGLGVSQPTVSRWLKKRTLDVGDRHRFEFVRKFGYNPDWFFSTQAPRFLVDNLTLDNACLSLTQLTARLVTLERLYSELYASYRRLLVIHDSELEKSEDGVYD